MSKSCTPKPRYRTTNWSSYNAALKSQGSLTIWLDKHMQWFTAASGKLGHSPKFSDAAIQLCLTIKNLFGLALRQATGFVESLLHLSGLSWPVPDFSTICRRQRNLQKSMCHIKLARLGCICLWTRQVSNFWVKASGNAKNTVLNAAANGASCILNHTGFGGG